MSDLTLQSVMDAKVQQCPYPYYRALRGEAPVRLTPEGTYLVSTFDLIVQVVHDSKTYSSMSPHGGGLGLHQSAPADALIKEKGYGRSLPVFVNLDPPDHTVYRRTLERYSAFERARPQEQLHYNLSFVLRGLSALDLTLAKAPVASSPVKAGAPT